MGPRVAHITTTYIPLARTLATPSFPASSIFKGCGSYGLPMRSGRQVIKLNDPVSTTVNHHGLNHEHYQGQGELVALPPKYWVEMASYEAHTTSSGFGGNCTTQGTLHSPCESSRTCRFRFLVPFDLLP